MKIGIIGLGLIGGSIAKALKRNTAHTIFGYDLSDEVNRLALYDQMIDEVLTDVHLKQCDVVIVALYPKETIAFLEKNAHKFQKGAIVTDICGLKEEICRVGEEKAKENGFYFIGGHPMAGKETWGYSSSSAALFEDASFLLTPSASTPPEVLKTLEDLYRQLRIKGVTITTPKEHDEIIAYTSQLAHVLSSAYIKSPTAQKHNGFSAGSFRDLTRVAGLNETMWSDLFLMNKDHLTKEIEILIGHLRDYQSAIANEDKAQLLSLLKEGNQIKQELS